MGSSLLQIMAVKQGTTERAGKGTTSTQHLCPPLPAAAAGLVMLKLSRPSQGREGRQQVQPRGEENPPREDASQAARLQALPHLPFGGPSRTAQRREKKLPHTDSVRLA